MEYDPAGDFSIKRPNKVRVSYAGRPYPVSYDSRNIEHAENISGVVFDREEAFLFRDMMDDGGRCVYKSYDGDVYKADVELNVTPRYTASEIWGDVKASLTRIDGAICDGLAREQV